MDMAEELGWAKAPRSKAKGNLSGMVPEMAKPTADMDKEADTSMASEQEALA